MNFLFIISLLLSKGLNNNPNKKSKKDIPTNELNEFNELSRDNPDMNINTIDNSFDSDSESNSESNSDSGSTSNSNSSSDSSSGSSTKSDPGTNNVQDYTFAKLESFEPECKPGTGYNAGPINIPFLNPTPHDIFNLFFTPEIISTITNETNLYSQQFFKSNPQLFDESCKSNFANFKQVKEKEIRMYLAIQLLFGIHRLSNIEDHWSKNKFLHTILGDFISRSRFAQISSFFHLYDNNKINEKHPEMSKISPMFEVIKNFSKYYRPGENIAIDEGIAPFYGRSKMTVFNPMKPDS